MKQLNTVLVSTMFFSCVGCVHIPPHTFQVPPITVPVPSVQSTGTITVTGADLSSVGQAMTGVAPPMVEAKKFPSGALPNPWWHFDRQNTGVAVSGGELFMTAKYQGILEAKGGPSGLVSCRLDPLFLIATVAARPQLENLGIDWFLVAADTSASIVRGDGSDTHCGPFGIFDVSGKVDERLGDLAGQVKTTVDEKKFPLPVKDLVSKLTGPLLLPTKGPGQLCLYPRITGITIGKLEGATLASVDVPFQFAAAPSLLLSSASSCPPAGPAPGVVQLSTSPVPAPFRILGSLSVDYPTATQIAAKTLKPIHGRWGFFGYHFNPSEVQVGDAQGQTFVQVTLHGSLSGTVFFWGTPVLSPDGKTISFPNLNLAAESMAVLKNINIQLPCVIVTLLQQPLKEALTFHLDDDLNQIKEGTSRPIPLDGGKGTLFLSNFLLNIASVRSIPSGVQGDVILEGTASATISDIAFH